MVQQSMRSRVFSAHTSILDHLALRSMSRCPDQFQSFRAANRVLTHRLPSTNPESIRRHRLLIYLYIDCDKRDRLYDQNFRTPFLHSELYMAHILSFYIKCYEKQKQSLCSGFVLLVESPEMKRQTSWPKGDNMFLVSNSPVASNPASTKINMTFKAKQLSQLKKGTREKFCKNIHNPPDYLRSSSVDALRLATIDILIVDITDTHLHRFETVVDA
ncbi:hypothetical protein TNCV_1528271 [Trichonephila clavipes]|nr:hypothetical protein TNCV_1528271 [Trichonephila clavipes]